MPSYVKAVFQQVMMEQIGMAHLSARVQPILNLFTKLGNTELHTYFVPQGVEELANIVFSEPDITSFVFNLSAAYRLELAIDDETIRIDTVHESIASAIYDEGDKPDKVIGRYGLGAFYVAKQSNQKSRSQALNANEWLLICVLLRANLALWATLVAELTQVPEPSKNPAKPAPITQGKIPA